MYTLENTVWAIQTKDNPEKLATYDTQHKEKQQKHNTIYFVFFLHPLNAFYYSPMKLNNSGIN
jgi:hypothetical protein